MLSTCMSVVYMFVRRLHVLLYICSAYIVIHSLQREIQMQVVTIPDNSAATQPRVAVLLDQFRVNIGSS